MSAGSLCERWMILGMSLFAGCDNQVSDAGISYPASNVAQTLKIVESTSEASTAKGYVHSVSSSKFSVGDILEQKNEFGLSKIIGSQGVFGTVIRSGWAIGIPNANSQAKKLGPLTASEEVHNSAARDYFVAAGLPAVQIAYIVAHASMHQGPALGDLVDEPLVFDGFTSVISRQVDGILVSESFASASFNSNGEVVDESIYWPPIPASIMDTAKGFRAHLASPIGKMAFLALLPSGLTQGDVMIHHSFGDPWSSDEMAVAYDVIDTSGHVHHFDRQGREFELKREQSRPSTPSPKKTYVEEVPMDR